MGDQVAVELVERLDGGKIQIKIDRYQKIMIIKRVGQARKVGKKMFELFAARFACLPPRGEATLFDSSRGGRPLSF